MTVDVETAIIPRKCEETGKWILPFQKMYIDRKYEWVSDADGSIDLSIILINTFLSEKGYVIRMLKDKE